MNPLTLVKRIQSINSKEATLGISEEASWHAKYKDSAYVFVGGIPFELTEGDLLAVFAQYGEVVDVNLVRDKGTGKSKGFAFLAYEDQRSTILAVDNLNGAQVSGRTIRVDHVSNYKKKEEEDEEAEQQKREARGVCRAFQRGECTRGAGCKFSHNEQRAANTGWGAEDNRSSKWGHDRFEAPKMTEKGPGSMPPFREPEPSFRARINDRASQDYHKNGDKTIQKRSGRYDDNEFQPKPREDHHRAEEKRGRRYDDDDKLEPKLRESRDRRDDKRSRRHDDFEPKLTEDSMREERRPRGHNDDELKLKPREERDMREQKTLRRHDDRKSPEICTRKEEKRSGRHDDNSFEAKSREDHDGKEGKRPRRPESESYTREDRDKRGGDKQGSRDRDSCSHRHRER